MKDQRKTKAQLIAELETLRQSEERYRQLFESANDAIISLTLDGIITAVNRGAEVLLGWSREEQRGRHYREFLTPSSFAFTEERARRIQAGEKVSSIYEVEVVRKDGSVVPVETRSRFIRDREGKPIGILVINRDITARKRVEEALRASEEKYRAIFSASPDFIYLTDTEGYILDANPALLNRAGLSLEQMRQRHFMDFFTGENRQEVEQASEKLKSGQPIHKLEVRARNALGECFEYEVNATPLLKEGVPHSTLSLARDMTERKRMEEALRESERRYRSFFENANDGIVSISLDGTITAVNRGLEVMTGWSREELIGQHYSKIVTPRAAALERERTRKALAGEKPSSVYEVEVKRKDGSVVPFEGKSRFIRDREGKPIGHQTILRDITERKRAEEALRQQEALFHTLAEATPAAVFLYQGTRFLYTNSTCTSISGYTQEELQTMNFWDVIHPEFRGLVKERGWLRQQGAQVPAQYEVKILTKNGEERWIYYSARLIDFEGQPSILATAFDITDRKQAEEEQQRLQQQLFQAKKLEALGTLAGGVAHDFNNILSTIMGFTELATDEVPEGTMARRNLEEVLKASRRAKALAQQILTFSQSNQQKREPIQPQPIIEEVLTFLRALPTKAITFHHSLDTLSAPVLADPTQIQQVLMNLCLNAVQAMEEKGGVLEVSLTRADVDGASALIPHNLKPGPHVRLTVRDTGCGMTPEVMQRIFDPFFTTKPVGQGSGLGLSIVHRIVANHGGAITVESQLGQGTTFHVYLPLNEHVVWSENAPDQSSSLAGVNPENEKGEFSHVTHSGH